MQFVATAIPQVVLIDLEPVDDERGFFARCWCRREFLAQGLQANYVQHSISYNAVRGTLRGLHYQAAPHEEAKIVRVMRGAIHDVVLDLRPHSPTFHKWLALQLSADNRRMLYVPEGCAHGFLTLEDRTEVLYLISEYYCPASARGVRWDDPLLQDAWPMAPQVISPRDRNYANAA